MNQDPFTHQIIGKAMEAHRSLGPGLAEEFYHRDLVERLRASGIALESKPRRELVYRGHIADVFEPDLLFPGSLVAELKSLRGDFAPEHFTQLLAYLKFCGIGTGLLFDFGQASLLFKRVVFSQVESEFPEVTIPSWIEPPDVATMLLRVVRRAFGDHGLGYRESTWRGLVVAALRAEKIGHVVEPMATIARIGVASLRCMVIEARCALAIGALGEGVSAADRAYLQTCLRWLGLSWGVAIHFGRRIVDVRFVRAPSGKDFPQIQETADFESRKPTPAVP